MARQSETPNNLSVGCVYSYSIAYFQRRYHYQFFQFAQSDRLVRDPIKNKHGQSRV